MSMLFLDFLLFYGILFTYSIKGVGYNIFRINYWFIKETLITTRQGCNTLAQFVVALGAQF